MKKLSVLSLILVFIACSTGKNASTEAKQGDHWKYPTEKASSQVNAFIQEMKKDLGSGELSSYVPSDAAQRKFGLIELDSQYYIGGIAKVSSSFSKDDFKSMGVKIETDASPILTVKVPVTELLNLLKSSQILYFETNNSVEKR